MSPISDTPDANPSAERLAFSISALSAATSVSRSLIYEHIRLGLLKATKVNNRTVVLREHAEEWLRSLPKGVRRRNWVSFDRW